MVLFQRRKEQTKRTEVKIAKILNLPNVRILLHILENGEARYSGLSRLVRSRGALSNAFRELDAEKLIQRRIAQETRPIQSYYSLTKRGKEVATGLAKMRSSLSD